MKYIMIAKQFPAYHPRKGQPTGFRNGILTGGKIHTLRDTAGGKVTGDIVSLREWAGRPYASKQVEFARCRVSVEPFEITAPNNFAQIVDVAMNDGFTHISDFLNWFKCKNCELRFSGVRIWFEDVRPVAGRDAQ